VAAELRKVAGVHGAVAPDSPAWRRRGTALIEAVPVPDGGSAGRDGRFGGQLAENADFIDAVYGSLPLIIALMAITTFVPLARAFRSLLLPAKAILLNVLSIAAAWGVLVWSGSTATAPKRSGASTRPARSPPGCR
jgi:putative drug exporter of the RND superfamily